MENYTGITVIGEAVKGYMENPSDSWRQHRIARLQGVVDAVEKISDAVNGCDTEEVAQVMVEALLRQHRTLQSSSVEAVVRVLYRYAGIPDHAVDPRNEGARYLCRDVVQGLETVDSLYEDEPRLMVV